MYQPNTAVQPVTPAAPAKVPGKGGIWLGVLVIVAGIGGGAVFRLNSRFGLRAGIALNVHGRAKGPVTSYGGLEYRW